MLLSEQLAEAADLVPWDLLSEQYGIVDPVYSRRRSKEPKYTGLIGKRSDDAIAKGYVDFGLIDPSFARERAGEWAFLGALAEKIVTILTKKPVAYIRDPENVMGIAGIDTGKLAAAVKQYIAGHFREEGSYASEREDNESERLLAGAARAADNMSVVISRAVGKTGDGYKIVAKPTFSELNTMGRRR